MIVNTHRLTLTAADLPSTDATLALSDAVNSRVMNEVRRMIYAGRSGPLVVELPTEVMFALGDTRADRVADVDRSLLDRLRARFDAHDVTFVDARLAALQRLDAAFRERGFVLVPEVLDARGPKVAKAPGLRLSPPNRGHALVSECVAAPGDAVGPAIMLLRQAVEIPRLGCVVAYFGPAQNGPTATDVERAWLNYIREEQAR